MGVDGGGDFPKATVDAQVGIQSLEATDTAKELADIGAGIDSGMGVPDSATDEVLLNHVEGGPKVCRHVVKTLASQQRDGSDRIQVRRQVVAPAQLDALLGKVHGIVLGDGGLFPSIDALTDVGGSGQDGVGGVEHSVHLEANMGEAQGSDCGIGYDEAVGADEAEHASPNLEAVGSVVGVDDQGFDTLLTG